MTKIINLFGAPSAGKSTLRAGIFFYLKTHGYSVEEVTEFAKDLVWDQHHAFETEGEPQADMCSDV